MRGDAGSVVEVRDVTFGDGVYTVEVVLRALLRAAMDRNGGDTTAVAHDLGVARKTVYNWLHSWGMCRHYLTRRECQH